VCDVHSKFIDWLTKEGLKPSEWPLNTSTEGLEALRAYCTGLLGERPDEWIRAHSGRNAAARLAVGKGIAPILPTLRPFGAVQLDFHKVDSACIISIINPFGAEINVPLARWHIGLIVEERFDLILGAVLALETTPSADSVLETIESALVPITVGDDSCALAIGIGRKVFPNQIFSSLAQGQCFSILRMDNGWSNTALDVIDNVIDTIGCAVHYGPVRAWWGRDTIERVFGQLTRSGLQRSPATYGSNPLDSRKKDSNEEALVLEIRLSDLTNAIEHQIALHNASRTEALLMGSPISALEAAMTNPASGFILSPLPANPSELPLLMYHIEVRAVRGDVDKGERPYVKLGKWRYTNERLSSDFLFIGRILRLYVFRRDPRIVFASCVETGEDLGRLNPPNRFLDVSVSWRARALLQRAGGRQRRIERREMNADHWMGIEAGEVKPSAKASTGRGLGKQALKAAKAAVMRDISEPFEGASVVPFTEQASSLATHDRAGWLSLDAKVQISGPCEGDAS
jgi:hypothetical protein